MPIFEFAYTSHLHKLKLQENLEEKHLRRLTTCQLVSATVHFSQQNTCTCEWTNSLTTVSHWYEPQLVNEPYQSNLFNDWAIHLQLKFLQSVSTFKPGKCEWINCLKYLEANKYAFNQACLKKFWQSFTGEAAFIRCLKFQLSENAKTISIFT